MISKQFHHQLWVGEWQPLLGPLESMREHVVTASKAMKMGDWKTCCSFIISEKMNEWQSVGPFPGGRQSQNHAG